MVVNKYNQSVLEFYRTPLSGYVVFSTSFLLVDIWDVMTLLQIKI